MYVHVRTYYACIEYNLIETNDDLLFQIVICDIIVRVLVEACIQKLCFWAPTLISSHRSTFENEKI